LTSSYAICDLKKAGKRMITSRMQSFFISNVQVPVIAKVNN